MTENQNHGFEFEKWFKTTFFPKHQGVYSDKWDIPSNAQPTAYFPKHFIGYPISLKTAESSSPIYLGDILRQRQTSEPFIMIVCFWTQSSPTEKKITDIGFHLFQSKDWNCLWGTLDINTIKPIDTKIKNLSLPYPAARIAAQAWKKEVLPATQCCFGVHPKIDSKKQRRFQCSFPNKTFREIASFNFEEVFKTKPLQSIKSSPRTRNKKG